MEKKIYNKPQTETIAFITESLLETASPGVDGEYNPDLEIESKGSYFFEEEDDEE